MKTPIHIILLEDSDTDATLIGRTLHKAGLECTIRRVADEAAFRAALTEAPPQVVLSDYKVPGFRGDAALAVAREFSAELPFLCVSGTIGEELAVDLMRAGATDYVLKDRMERLPLALRRALDEVAQREARRTAEEAVRHSNEKLALALEASSLGTWDWRIATGELDWSERCKAIFGIPAGEPMNYGRFLRAIHPDDRRRADAAMTHALAEKTPYDIEFRTQWPDGSMHWVASRGRAFYDDATGKAVRMAGTALDISHRKAAEQEIHDSLREKEVLLREVHHRVKNNLQIVSSLLSLQTRQLTDPALIAGFASTRERVRAMAAVHERLIEKGDFATIDLAAHIGTLARMLTKAHAPEGVRLRCEPRLEPVMVDLNAAVPLSLIVNELILNAAKYAYAGRSEGELKIELRAGAERHELLIADDGPGLPAGLEPEKTKTLGLRLVRDLARQIRAEVQIDSSPAGTSIRIAWPGRPHAQPTSQNP